PPLLPQDTHDGMTARRSTPILSTHMRKDTRSPCPVSIGVATLQSEPPRSGVGLVPAYTRETRPELVAFASWLRSRMRARRMTTSALAQRIASSSSGVSEWMRALRQPRLETLRRLSEEFATPLEEFGAVLPDPP